jgi:hypothetical protein
MFQTVPTINVDSLISQDTVKPLKLDKSWSLKACTRGQPPLVNVVAGGNVSPVWEMGGIGSYDSDISGLKCVIT